MPQNNFVASVAERDIDLVLLEEFCVSDEFCDWFAARVEGAPIFRSRIGAWHSVSNERGESDLVFTFKSEDDAVIGILIENKIDAVAQPAQSERYRERGEKGRIDGEWSTYKTCVVAPDKYLGSSRHVGGYDAEISYEEIVAFFSSRRFRDPRYLHKARLVQEGVVKNKRGYQPAVNEVMTSFATAYIKVASERFPQLRVQPAKPRAGGNTWISFYPQPFPVRTEIYHQLQAGFVKVMFIGRAAESESIQARYAGRYTSDVEIDIAGTKSVSISIKVPKIEPYTHSFEDQSEKAVEGMKAADRLLGLVRAVEGLD